MWNSKAETLSRDELQQMQLTSMKTIFCPIGAPGTLPRSEGKAVRVIDRRW